MWRCLNDIFGYCKDEPIYKSKPKEIGIEGGVFAFGTCKLDPRSCDKYQSLSQQLEGKTLPSSGYRVGKRGKLVKVKGD